MPENYALSDVDRRILNLLLIEGAHLSESHIAEKLKLNQTTINYKLRNLWDKHVITGTYYRLNPLKFGLPGMAWLFIKLNRNAHFGVLKKGLLEHRNVFSIKAIAGGNDLLVKIFYEDDRALSAFLLWMETTYKKEIDHRSLSIVLDRYKMHRTRVDDEKHFTKTRLSKLDKDLIRARFEKPLLNFKEISEMLGAHRNTVAQRWNRLLDERVIMKKGIDVNPVYLPQLNAGISLVLLIDAETGRTAEAAEYLSGFPDIHLVTTISAGHDLLGILRHKDVAGAYDFMRNVYTCDAIKKTRSVLVYSEMLKQWGHDFAPFI